MSSMSSAGTSKNPSIEKDRAQPWMLAVDGLMAASLVVPLATGMTAPEAHARAGVAFVVLAVVPYQGFDTISLPSWKACSSSLGNTSSWRFLRASASKRSQLYRL